MVLLKVLLSHLTQTIFQGDGALTHARVWQGQTSGQTIEAGARKVIVRDDPAPAWGADVTGQPQTIGATSTYQGRK